MLCVCACAADSSGAKFVPPADRTLLIVGQDFESIAQYRKDCSECPVPGGVTTYLGFYDLLSADANQFGGLGETATGDPAGDGDWGAGRANAGKPNEGAVRDPRNGSILGYRRPPRLTLPAPLE